MVFVQFVIDEEGQYSGTIKSVPVSVHHKLSDLWQGLVTDGLITQVRGLVWARCLVLHDFRKRNPNNKVLARMPDRVVLEKSWVSANFRRLEISASRTGVSESTRARQKIKMVSESLILKFEFPSLANQAKV